MVSLTLSLIMKGVLKLIDFGIAKVIPDGTVNIRRDYQTGSINYMAPEQIKFSESDSKQIIKIGRASDIWSLGCILYQLIYKLPPFHKFTMIQKLQKIVDVNYEIEYPADSPYSKSHSTKVALAVGCIKRCLTRRIDRRTSIDALLKDELISNTPLCNTASTKPVESITLSRMLEMVNELSRVPELGCQDLNAISTVLYRMTTNARSCLSSLTVEAPLTYPRLSWLISR